MWNPHAMFLASSGSHANTWHRLGDLDGLFEVEPESETGIHHYVHRTPSRTCFSAVAKCAGVREGNRSRMRAPSISFIFPRSCRIGKSTLPMQGLSAGLLYAAPPRRMWSTFPIDTWSKQAVSMRGTARSGLGIPKANRQHRRRGP
jgi:hypothetical protein